ncbi:LPS export ABC transporter ATP-binding protein [Desulfovibrio sp. OttesenSCG-928-F20]|nr:LPS export ABC transporter ATP-binding protein [Desulfovibrio sp. OttesenSCG-928-M16]MDL2290597.1 LPS export ABC transporter ATP-binding protein [Desulfovibrio sp. OttesenSCG-928-F20]
MNQNSSHLIARELRKRYGDREVVRGVSLDVQEREIVGLLGPNGAGKTTSFYMIIGIQKPTAGSVFLNGRDIAALPLHERARQGLSYLPQESSVFKRLSVIDNLRIILEYTQLSKAQQKEKAEQLLEEFSISHLRNSLASHLSGGERRRLEIARSLIREPQFVLLDEPFAGIDPLAVDDIQSLIRDLRNRNIGVLISDHNVRETLKICDRAYLLHEGTVIVQGTPDDLVNDPKARRVYLGEAFTM